MPTSFTVRIEDKDWEPAIGGWHCPALGIPGADVRKVYSAGAVVDPATYQIDIANRMLRWSGSSRPTSLVVEILLEKGLTTSTASARLTAVVSVMTALISATATYYAARVKAPPVADAKDSVEASRPIPCSAMPDWPKGRWLNWGRFDNPPTAKETNNGERIPQIWPVVEFAADQHYESETEQKSDNRKKNAYTAQLEGGSDRMKPGATVHFHGSDGTGYEMWEKLKITDDGCMMNGEWKDTDGNYGTDGSYHYLYQSGRYFVPGT